MDEYPTHVMEKQYFVDEQRMGPYAIWHHEHFIEPHPEGVRMKDVIHYRPPLGFLGNLANAIFIRKQLNRILEHRKVVLNRIFPRPVDQV